MLHILLQPPIRYYLVSTICVLTGRRTSMRLAAYSRKDAEYIGSAVGYPVTVVDEINRPDSCDNDRVIRFATGDLNAMEPCYAH